MPTIQTVCIEPLNFSNTYGLYCRGFKLPQTIQTVCIAGGSSYHPQYKRFVLSSTIQTVCIVVGLQYKLFVLQLACNTNGLYCQLHNTNRLYCQVCNTNCLYCSRGLQYKRFVLQGVQVTILAFGDILVKKSPPENVLKCF